MEDGRIKRMAIYRTVSLTFWTDAKIVDDFTPEDRYFYLYLFTNTHSNLCGCYEVSRRQMANETGYSIETIERLLDRFEKIHEVIVYSKETKEVLLLNWHKYNWTKSEKFRKPLLANINAVKNYSFRDYLTRLFNGEDDGYRIDTKCIDTNCSDTSVTVTDTVSVTDTVTDNVSDTVTDTEKVTCNDIVNLYNDICVSMPKVNTVSESRKKVIKARLKHYTLDDFKNLFLRASASKFLNGENDKNWCASFDWLLKDSNMAKVLDGNYDNRAAPDKGQAAMDDFYQRIADWAEGG